MEQQSSFDLGASPFSSGGGGGGGNVASSYSDHRQQQQQQPHHHHSGWIPNRPRAQTLSPRQGLSHLYEDRPMLSDGANLQPPVQHQRQLRIPLFDGTQNNHEDGGNRNGPAGGGRSPNNHPGMVLRPPQEFSLQDALREREATVDLDSHLNVGEGFFNRPRTASAPTIPSFMAEQQQQQRLQQFDLGNGGGTSMDDHDLSAGVGNDLTNSVIESVLGLSDNSSARNETDSVFRSSPVSLQGTATISSSQSLEMFGSMGGASQHPHLQGHAESNLHNWTGLSGTRTASPFPNQTSVEEDALANSLGSVLKLSGIDSMPTSGSRLVSRLDPEMSVFTRSPLRSLGNGDDQSRRSDVYQTGLHDITRDTF